MKIIVDYRTSKDAIDTLLNMNYTVIKTPKLSSVYDAINGHSDIMFHRISENEVVCEPSVYDYFQSNLPDVCLIKGKTFLKEKRWGRALYAVAVAVLSLFISYNLYLSMMWN